MPFNEILRLCRAVQMKSVCSQYEVCARQLKSPLVCFIVPAYYFWACYFCACSFVPSISVCSFVPSISVCSFVPSYFWVCSFVPLVTMYRVLFKKKKKIISFFINLNIKYCKGSLKRAQVTEVHVHCKNSTNPTKGGLIMKLSSVHSIRSHGVSW